MTTPSKTQTAKTSRKERGRSKATCKQPEAPTKTTKLDLMVAKLSRPDGATPADLMTATGWQAYSVRGAIAGSLKKKGYVILSEKIEGVRRYRIGEPG